MLLFLELTTCWAAFTLPERPCQWLPPAYQTPRLEGRASSFRGASLTIS